MIEMERKLIFMKELFEFVESFVWERQNIFWNLIFAGEEVGWVNSNK